MLHRRELVVGVYRLEGDELGLRQAAPRLLLQRPRRQADPRPPRLVGRVLGSVDKRIGGVAPSKPACGQVVDVVLSGRRSRLENDLAASRRHAGDDHVVEPLSRARVKHEDCLLLRFGIAASPRQMDPDCIGRAVHLNHGPVVSQLVRPLADAAIGRRGRRRDAGNDNRGDKHPQAGPTRKTDHRAFSSHRTHQLVQLLGQLHVLGIIHRAVDHHDRVVGQGLRRMGSNWSAASTR